jgi:hypothetical protein
VLLALTLPAWHGKRPSGRATQCHAGLAGADFLTPLKADPRSPFLPAGELEAFLRPRLSHGQVDTIFKRVFGESERPGV